MRFFRDEDKKLAKEVALTQEEKDFFDKQEWILSKKTGYSKLSGGHVMITVIDMMDEPDGVFLQLRIQVGVEGEHLTYYGDMYYNRNTKQIEAFGD